MASTQRTFVTWLWTTLLFVILSMDRLFLSESYAGTILQSKVVDAETNAPLEGAVVVVVWERPVFNPLCMDSCHAVSDAAETVTGANGNFSIDISMGLMSDRRNITVYKPGYYPPSYTAAPWLYSTADPPAADSQLIRLIKAPSLSARSKEYVYSFGVCSPTDDSRFCVPPSKVKNYLKIRAIVTRLRDVELRDPEQPIPLPPLHEGVWRYEFTLVRFLLELGANPDDRDSKGRTALMSAALNGNLEGVKTLLSAGANPNLNSNDGNTALTYAMPTGRQIGLVRPSRPNSAPSFSGPLALVETLLKGGADPNVRVYDDLTPLMIASGRGLTEIVNTLLSHGADATLKAAFGLTAYEVANGEDMVAILKKAQGPRTRS